MLLEFRDYKKDECTVIATGEKKAYRTSWNLTYFILNLIHAYGAVQDLREQSLRLSSPIRVLRNKVRGC